MICERRSESAAGATPPEISGVQASPFHREKNIQIRFQTRHPARPPPISQFLVVHTKKKAELHRKAGDITT